MPRGSLVSALLACLSLAGAPASGQPVVRVNIGSPVLTIVPDLEVPVPVNINAPGDGLVSLTVEVGYPGKFLEYVGDKPGVTVERAKGKVRVAQKPGTDAAEEQVLTVEIESPQPLVAGTMVTLNFRPTDAVVERTEVPIRSISRRAKTASGKELEPQGTDGKVTLTPMVFSCFFYMH
jgi:hypothetical protein